MGGEAKQYQVVLDPQAAGRLPACRSRASSSVARAQQRARVGGGYIEKHDEAYVIRGDAQFKSLEDIANTVVTVDADGTPVLVEQLGSGQARAGAALRRGHQARRGRDRRRHGHDADRRQLARGGRRRQDASSPRSRRSCPPASQIRTYYDRAEFIDRMLHTVAINLAEGALASSSWSCSSRSAACAARSSPRWPFRWRWASRSSAWCGSASPATSCRSAPSTSACSSTAAIVMLEVALALARASAPERARRRRRRGRRGDAARRRARSPSRCSSSCSSICR